MSDVSSVEIRVAESSSLFGPGDALLKEFEAQYPDIQVSARGDQVKLSGPTQQVAVARKLLDQMAELVKRGQLLSPEDFRRAARMLAGLEATATTEQMLHADIAPVLSNGDPTVDGKLSINDIMGILRKALGTGP